jgi:biotin transport system substrate-specific component
MTQARTTSDAGYRARGADAILALPAGRVALTVGFSLLTWAGARMSVHLPYTPVPGTLQTLAVLLAGAALGPALGAASQMIYLGLGLAGLPVFALPGSGPFYFLGPTGGYLLGFVPAAYLIGLLLGRAPRCGAVRAALAFLAGSAVIDAGGILWLASHLEGDLSQALRLGLAPFVLFDLVKIALATAILTAGRRFFGTGNVS